MAGIENLKEFEKSTLRAFIDESIENKTPSVIDQYVGDEVTYNQTFAYDVVQRSNHIAAMIGLGAEKPVVDRHATASRMGEIAHFGLKDVITVEEMYAIYQARNSGEKNATIDKLINKAGDLVEWLQLRIRVEKLKATALGKNEYNKNGVKIELDYGIPDDHKIALSGDGWDDVERDIIGDLLEWDAQYRETNGQSADAILMTRKALQKLTKNKMVIAEAGRYEGATRVSEADAREVLTEFGLPKIEYIEDTSITVRDIYTGENETIEVFPENRLVFISKGVGDFLTGPNPDDETMQPVAVLNAYDERTPRRSIIEASQSGFAVLDNPNLLLHADVFTN